MDLNDSGNSGTLDLGVSWAASTYSVSGSPRGTITGPTGQTYNVYLTDPNLNLLDPNNSSGGGGALLLETDSTFSAIGTLVPQPDSVLAICRVLTGFFSRTRTVPRTRTADSSAISS